MAFSYAVYYGTAIATNNGTNPISTGWTLFATVTATTDNITGLTPNTSYYFAVKATDSATGASAQSIIGPVLTQASATSESGEGTVVNAPTLYITASKTPGQASSGPYDTWGITTNPGALCQVMLNGQVDGNTSAVEELYYHNHTVYYASNTGNSLGTPGWWIWQGSGVGWAASNSPVPNIPLIVVNTISNQTAGAAFNITGALPGYQNVPTLQYQDTSNGIVGAWNTLPAGASVSLSGGFSFSHPGMSPGVQSRVTIRDGNSTSISYGSNLFDVIASVTLQSIALSNTSVFPNSPIGSVVGAITVTTNPASSFTGTLSVTGTDAASFAINGSNLITNALLSSSQTYSINIVATQTNAGGSPLTQAFSITVSNTLAAFSMNPADATPGITVSNQGLTVEVTAAGQQGIRSAQCLVPQTSATVTDAKAFVYFEVTIDKPTDHWAVGICMDEFPLGFRGLGQGELAGGNNPQYASVGSARKDVAIGYYPYSSTGYFPGRIYGNSGYDDSQLAPIQGDVFVVAGTTNAKAGDVVGVALVTQPVYSVGEQGEISFTSTAMQADQTWWNNGYAVSNSRPITQTFPSSGFPLFTGAPPPPLYVVWTCSDIGGKATFNFGDQPFKYKPTDVLWNVSGTNYYYQAYNLCAVSPIDPVAGTTVSQVGNLRADQPTVSTSIPLRWDPPTGGTPPYSYAVEVPDSSFGATWQLLGTTTSTSYTAQLPANVDFQNFRVRATDNNGSIGAWSPTRLFFSVPYTSGYIQSWSVWASSATTSSVTFTIQPGVNISGANVYYTPVNASTVEFALNLHFPVQNTGWLTFGFVPAANTTFTITGLSSNTQYLILVIEVDPNGVEQSTPQTGVTGTGIICCTQPQSPYSGSFDGFLVPPNSELIPWGGGNMTVVAGPTTTHFALYYHTWLYDSTTGPALLNSLKTVCESVYNQCLTWFGATDSLHTPSIVTSINPTGSLINLFASGGQPFGAAHLSCRNADIVMSANSTADIGSVDVYGMFITAELTEVFMPQLQALPDCDQHALGEALSVSMAFSLYPNGMLVGTSALNTAAYWMDVAVNVNGAAANTKDEVTGTTAVGPFNTRGDWVNTNPAGEGIQQIPAIGCCTLFFGYLISQLGYTFVQICNALRTLPANCTMRTLYNTLANNTTDPFPTFLSLINTNYPGSVDQHHFTQNPFPL